MRAASGRRATRCCVCIGPDARRRARSCARPRASRQRSTSAGTRSTSRRRRCSALPQARREAHPARRSSSRRSSARRRPPSAAPDAAAALVEYARTHNLGRLVLGRANGRQTLLARWRQGQGWRASALAPDLDVDADRSRMPRADGAPARRPPSTETAPDSVARLRVAPLALCAIATLVAVPAAALVRAAEHRDAVPARRRRCGVALRARPGGRRSGPQRARVRLLLRAAALHRSRCPTCSTCSPSP